MSTISGVTIYPPQHSNILAAKETLHPLAQPECRLLVVCVQFTLLLPSGTIQQFWGCTSAVYGEMLFSPDQALWFLCRIIES